MKKIFIILMLLISCNLQATIDQLLAHIAQYQTDPSETVQAGIVNCFFDLDINDQPQARMILTNNGIVCPGINDEETLAGKANVAPVELLSDAVAEQLEEALTSKDRAQHELNMAEQEYKAVCDQTKPLQEQADALHQENDQLKLRIAQLHEQIGQLTQVPALNTNDSRDARIIGILRNQNSTLQRLIPELQAKKQELQELINKQGI